MASRSIKLVTLDATNTCIRVSRSVGYHYGKALVTHSGYSVEADTLEAHFRDQFKLNWKQFPNFGCYAGLSCSDWWKKVVTGTLRSSGYTGPVDGISTQLYQEFSGAQPWEVFPDVRNALQLLRENRRDISIGVVSNFDDRLDGILCSLGLRQYFDFIIASYEVKMAKPDAQIFKLAVNTAMVSPEEALHVGDNLELDYNAARATGMSAVLLRRQGGMPASSLNTADSLTDVVDRVLAGTIKPF